MKTVEVIFGVLAGVAIVNIVFFSGNSTSIINAVFGGTTGLFTGLTKNNAGTGSAASVSITGNPVSIG